MRGSEWWASAPNDLASEEYARHVLDAVERGWLYWQWRDLQVGPLTVQVMTQPLAVGTAEDHVHLYGMTAALMDRIVEAYRGLPVGRVVCGERVNRPLEIMPPTSLLLDAMAADESAVLAGPFLDTPGNNRKEDARRHSKRLQKAQRQRAVEYFGEHAHSFISEWVGSVLWPACKTYVLNPRHRPGYACEYGWHVASGWSPSAAALAFQANTWVPEWLPSSDPLLHGRVFQPEQWAHYDSQDYSMGALFVSAHGVLSHPAKHGRTRVERVDLRQLLADPERCHLVTVHGPQGWHTLGGPR